MTFRYTVWQDGKLVAGFCSLVDIGLLRTCFRAIVKDGDQVIWDGPLTRSWEEIAVMAERAAS
jgi:hypothetical protein